MTPVVRAYEFLKHVLFQYPVTRAHLWFRSFLLLTLFLIGIAHWVGFFNAGDWTLVALDWRLANTYFNTLREVQLGGGMLWQWDAPRMTGTQYILANPEIVLTPDIILLRWVANSIFVIIHVAIFYSVGFFGCLLIARELRASFVTFVFFWLVFNFNGYLIAHLAVGHLTWIGYFLLPLFFIVLSRFMVESQSTSSLNVTLVLGMGLLLGVLFLNGSFHFAIWCSMFMVIALFWRRAMFLNVIAAIIVGSLLGLGRLLPAVLFFRQDRAFIGGYASFGVLLDAFTTLRGHETVPWWERDIYIGFVAFIILVLCFAIAFKRNKLVYQAPFFAAASILLVFSLGNVFAPIVKSPLPFADIERVPSRFIVMPFMVFLITALGGMEELFRSWPKSGRGLVLIALPFVAYELANHSRIWRVERLNRSFTDAIEPVLSLASTADPLYTLTVYAGWTVSIVLFGVVVALLLWKHRRSTLAGPA